MSRKRSWRFLSLVVLALALPPPDARPSACLEVDPQDRILRIRGWLGEESTFAGNVRLTARGGDVAHFNFLASDLRRKEDGELLGRQQVSLVGEPALMRDVPRDFPVRVAGVRLPGTYSGRIELLLPGRPRSGAVSIPVTVEARARPSLTPLKGSDQVQLRLVNCSGGLDLLLARLLLPAGSFQKDVLLQFENAVVAPVKLTGAKAVVAGEQTQYRLTGKEVSATVPTQWLPAGQIISVPLRLNREFIPADHYTGALHLAAAGRDERLKVPVDLSVRVGPFWPLVVLLVGILLGRLVKYMRERGGPQAQSLGLLNRLEADIQESDPQDQVLLSPMVEEVRRSIYRERLDEVSKLLDGIRQRMKTLAELRAIERMLAGKEQHPSVLETLEKIERARELLALKEDEAAAALLGEVRQAIASLTTTMMGPNGRPDAAVARAAGHAEAAERAAVRAGAAPRLSPSPHWFRRLIAFLTGISDTLRAEVTPWLGLLLYVVSLFAILALGINSLYVEKGTTFGATPFPDYMGLVLWGLSADVVSRSLSDLPSAGGRP